MAEASPPSRPIATGALRRVYEKRVGARAASPSKRRTPAPEVETESESEGDAEEVDDALATSPRKPRAPRSQTTNTSHHYTLNMPSPAAAPPDTPYVLLGCVAFFYRFVPGMRRMRLALRECISRLRPLHEDGRGLDIAHIGRDSGDIGIVPSRLSRESDLTHGCSSFGLQYRHRSAAHPCLEPRLPCVLWVFLASWCH
jgi:hypothetical protein